MASGSSYVQNIASFFKNLTLNALGVERDLYQLIEDRDISRAIAMMDNNDVDVDNALSEYNPQLHAIMQRRNKARKDKDTYEVCKLPRALQKYINEVEVFFLLGNGITFKKEDGDDEAFKVFMDFVKETRYDAMMRKVKRLSGSETEAAKLYYIYRDDEGDGKAKCNVVVLARSTGYSLRPLFDQFGNLIAFAYGYVLKESGKAVQHWDIQTPDMLFFCKKNKVVGWEVEQFPNPTGRINILYFKQEKAWSGAERRIARIEDLDSKIGDTNNYFADPIACATADVVESISDPDMPAKLLQMTGEKSRFEYVNPPQSSELRAEEKKDLHDSVLFDTLTPDLDFQNMRGLGTLSGTAVKNSMVLGYIKRDKNREVYDEMVDRDINVIKGVLKLQHPELEKKIDELVVSHVFNEPFAKDEQADWQALVTLYGGGLVSLETAVERLSLTDAPEEEVDRIRMAETEKMMAEQELAEEQQQQKAQEPAKPEKPNETEL